MATMAKTLQVGPVKAGTTLGDGPDVINMEGGAAASPAEWLGGQVRFPQAAPCSVVAAFGAR